MNKVRVDMFKKGDPSSIWEMNGPPFNKVYGKM